MELEDIGIFEAGRYLRDSSDLDMNYASSVTVLEGSYEGITFSNCLIKTGKFKDCYFGKDCVIEKGMIEDSKGSGCILIDGAFTNCDFTNTFIRSFLGINLTLDNCTFRSLNAGVRFSMEGNFTAHFCNIQDMVIKNGEFSKCGIENCIIAYYMTGNPPKGDNCLVVLSTAKTGLWANTKFDRCIISNIETFNSEFKNCHDNLGEVYPPQSEEGTV